MPEGESLIDQQKYRALRIDHTYHSKPHAWRRWMRALSFILPVAALAALGALLYSANGPDLYEPGPVSNRHIWFNNRCQDCHEKENGKFGVVTNAKCRVCHDGPLHNKRQIVAHGGETVMRREQELISGASSEMNETLKPYNEPRCASCHTEHKGSQQLVLMPDASCTQCHMDLKVTDGTPNFKSGIASFTSGHPDWRALRKEAGDPPDKGNDRTPIKFNHAKHMEVAYDPESKYGPRKMQCNDCHRASESNLELMASGSWRLDEFAEKTLKPSERIAFYEDVGKNAQASGILRYKMSREDIRKITVEALSRREVYAELKKNENDRAAFRAILERAVMSEIRERFGNAGGTGQKRYMLPITYEKHCATECHTHELTPVNGITPPHGKAENARQFLRAALYADTVAKALGGGAKSEADKAKTPLVKKIRDALQAEIKMPEKAPTKGELNKLLVDDMRQKDDLHQFIIKTLGVNEDQAAQLVAPKVDPDEFKKFDRLKKAKKEEELNTSIGDELEKLITNFAGDKPPDAKDLDAMTDEKLAAGTAKLFAPTNSEKGACLYCHVQNEKIPADVVIEPNIPVRWLTHSIFNHETHRVIACESCHNTARTSKETSDVLLPNIQSCQLCHNQKGARMDCVECHVYHDKTHQKQDSAVPIEGLLKRGADAVAPLTPDATRK
ncbi:MAG TPA: cytochrome c3 family protein [Planctomycetota bacterium]|nr:cytochrome c3 family protein [Planctomycetota bacterium]